MNQRSRQRNKERNKYAKLKNIVNSTVKGLDPIDIPNCSNSLANDPITYFKVDESARIEKLAKYKQQRIERGFDDTELWNLEFTIAKYVLPRLIEFRKVMNGYPANVESFEKYQEMVDKMIYSFDHIVNEETYTEQLEKDLGVTWDGVFEMKKIPDGNYELLHTDKYNEELMKKYREEQMKEGEKIDEGLELFGKYFRSLWW